MRVGGLIVAGGIAAALIWWASTEDAGSAQRQNDQTDGPAPVSAVAPPVEQGRAKRHPLTPAARLRSVPPIPPDRIVNDVLTPGELSERDFPAFRLIMGGLKGNRPAIEQCVFDMENAVKQPTVLQWSLVFDVTTEDGVARVRDVISDEWPEAMPPESRECFSTAFAGVEFDTNDERFSYRVAYPMGISVAPPPPGQGT